MPGYIYADVAALRAEDMSSVNEVVMRIVEGQGLWLYYPTAVRPDNGIWIIQPTTGGGAYYPTCEVQGTGVPTGFSEYPVQYLRIGTSSSGAFVAGVHRNPGNTTDWEQIW